MDVSIDSEILLITQLPALTSAYAFVVKKRCPDILKCLSACVEKYNKDEDYDGKDDDGVVATGAVCDKDEKCWCNLNSGKPDDK